METHILGFPRIGTRRELKKALEAFWGGAISRVGLIAVGDALKRRHWRIQKDAGLAFVSTGDFSFYDHVLDASIMLGAVPQRFSGDDPESLLETSFRMARGDAAKGIPAMEMTKWFDTNYHYIVPEFSRDSTFRLSSRSLVDDSRKAKELGFRPKPVLLGPITFLCLGKSRDSFDRWSCLDRILDVYREILAELSSFCDWIELDEPILCTDLPAKAREAFVPSFGRLKSAAGPSRLLLASYYGDLGENLDLALNSGCDGLHIDFTRRRDHVEEIGERLPESMILSAGIVDGRNVWKTDLRQALSDLNFLESRLGRSRLMIGSGCPLIHVPTDLEMESRLDPEIKSWMAFAVQKCGKLDILGRLIEDGRNEKDLRDSDRVVLSRRTSGRIHRKDVLARAAAVSPDMLNRKSPFSVRKSEQQELRPRYLPTTTIGSFPQTKEIRDIRMKFRKGMIGEAEYESFMKNEIAAVVEAQERLGLDVLVHGEAERNDMVEYFGERMEGFCFTENGWVQSYGSRCVKPPVIYGDVSRPAPMTVDWISWAQSLTEKPMKGMLTGPVTILAWSFVRDDLHRSEVCRQIALAIRDEVHDLEEAGIRVIQIDEPALREGLPLRTRDAEAYLRWAVDAFRLASSGVSDKTQIHTHMCYSDFNSIISWIAEMDADVISIESSRSGMELLEAFRTASYPNDIGPGVYDIHSPRIPSIDEIEKLIRRSLKVIPADRLWINPDCGLKTRSWPEATESIRNMVEAARAVREEIELGDRKV